MAQPPVDIGRRVAILVESQTTPGTYAKMTLLNTSKSISKSINVATAPVPDDDDPTALTTDRSFPTSIAPPSVSGEGQFTPASFALADEWMEEGAAARNMRIVVYSETDGTTVLGYWQGRGFPSQLEFTGGDAEVCTASATFTITGSLPFTLGAPPAPGG